MYIKYDDVGCRYVGYKMKYLVIISYVSKKLFEIGNQALMY